MEIVTRNVNTAFREIVSGIYSGSIKTERRTTRNGPTLRIPEPTTITYERPTERVLFNQMRDANCFFHLYEAIWMLSGRNDVEPLAYYNSQIRQFSDDGLTFNGAYGYRWRGCGTGFDQIKEIVRQLKEDPDSRRCVLDMWNPGLDLFRNPNKDKCCNLCAVFSISEGRLNMSVYNRSNDLIWGTLGANVVHFSFLLEYVAAWLGLQVGKYHQISTDQHVYTDRFEPEKWLAWYNDTSGFDGKLSIDGDYSFTIKTIPLVKDPATFDRECAKFVERHSRDALAGDYKEPFLELVAQPMMIAFHWHKRRDYSAALACIETVQSGDWRIAATNWLLKRKANYEHKQGI